MTRTTYCGLVSEALMGQTVTLMGWAHRRARPRRRDLHRPARPRRPGADRLRPRPRRDVQDRRGRAQRVLPEGRRARCGRARPAPRTANLTSGKIEVLCHELEVLEPERDAAVPARRREPVGDDAPDASRARPAPPDDAEEHDAALPRARWRCASSSTATASSTSRRRC